MSKVYDLYEFHRKVKAAAPKEMRYVLVCVDGEGGGNSFVEHSNNLDGYQVLGILEWGKNLKLAECERSTDEQRK